MIVAKEHRFTIIRNADKYSDSPRTATAWDDEFQRAKKAAKKRSVPYIESGDFLYFDNVSDNDLDYIVGAMELSMECDGIVIYVEYYAKGDFFVGEDEDGMFYYEKDTEAELHSEFVDDVKGFNYHYETNWFTVKDQGAFINVVKTLPGDFYYNIKGCADGTKRYSFSGTGEENIDVSVFEDIATETVVIEKTPLY